MSQNVNYQRGFYNKVNDKEQWIRLSDGCYRNCWNCYCPTDKLSYDLPTITRNKVRFLDMNFLYAHSDVLGILTKLPTIKVDKKVVKYTFLCGLDFTLLNLHILKLCKKARIGRFNNKGNWLNGLNIAWDRGYDEKDKLIEVVGLMEQAGYSRKNITCFMVCNGKVSYTECLFKLKVLKDLRVQIQDCWYDNQKRGSIKPVYWTENECKLFGKLCRAHNIAVIQRMYDSLDVIYDEQERV